MNIVHAGELTNAGPQSFNVNQSSSAGRQYLKVSLQISFTFFYIFLGYFVTIVRDIVDHVGC